ncbi:MAG: DUF1326 domain-containing protein [Geminicoccaceae bacterium]
MVDWYIEGISFGSCNCISGCPCQFEGQPTLGHCRGFEVFRITKGHFAEVGLEGLVCAVTYAWPGPIYEGKGEMQLIIDERADAAQRAAIETVLKGGETEEARTHWWVFHAMSVQVHPTLFKPIEFECDIEARTARAVIPGILQSTGRPIVSPATGAPHRVRIDIPQGIEFELAEVGCATSKGSGAVALDLVDTYGQFNHLRHSGSGVVH